MKGQIKGQGRGRQDETSVHRRGFARRAGQRSAVGEKPSFGGVCLVLREGERGDFFFFLENARGKIPWKRYLTVTRTHPHTHTHTHQWRPRHTPRNRRFKSRPRSLSPLWLVKQRLHIPAERPSPRLPSRSKRRNIIRPMWNWSKSNWFIGKRKELGVHGGWFCLMPCLTRHCLVYMHCSTVPILPLLMLI